MNSLRILVADDDSDIRYLLQAHLSQQGHSVTCVDNGNSAWAAIRTGEFQVLITDWMMPEVTGLELCKRVRAAEFDHYLYIILLTGRSQQADLIAAIGAGADEFISKPFFFGELQVRLRACARILEFEERLKSRNRELTAINQQLSNAYAIIRRDLEVAAKLQIRLLPKSGVTRGGSRFESFFHPCEFVAGDLFNYFELPSGETVLYLLDVAGHGVPAAMLAVAASKLLNPGAELSQGEVGAERTLESLNLRFPLHVAEALNRVFHNPRDSSQYFTMIYAVIHPRKRLVQLTQAGHPSPLLLSPASEPRFIGDGGYPVGLFKQAKYELQEFEFQPGDRLILYSDGVTDCQNDAGEPYTAERLKDEMLRSSEKSLREALVGLSDHLREWRIGTTQKDDISLLAVEFS